MGAVVYFAIRLTFGRLGDVVIHTGSGLGFSEMSSEQLRNVFEHAPWLFWIYNLCASLLTLIASEPRAGVYRFVDALLRGQAAPWQWVHVASSLLTTAVIALALAARRPYSARDRQLIASGLVLFVCGVGLGVLYTRDRIGLFAGVGYGILLYVACAAWLERPPAIRWWRPIAAGAIALVALAWTVRCTEAYFQLRYMAWDHYVEWTERYEDLGGSAQPLTPLLKTLRSAAMDVAPADPRRGPAWSYALFERRFTRSGRPAASPDRAADAAVAPLSTRFNIRWKPDVDEAARLRLEGELGLAEGSPVDRDATGRTWEYRLRRPTPERIRALVLSEAVDDTANIDPERFEILR